MKAYVFSIGEKTTSLCCELMKEYGFDVVLFKDDSSLWEKLVMFYEDALCQLDEQFVRIDADIIPNKNVLKLIEEPADWNCAVGFDWYKQDRGAISIHVMDKAIIQECLKNVEGARDKVRPETHLWRHPNINPHTQIIGDYSCGIHGYGQADHRERIKKLKASRDQAYDWDLIERIEAL